MPPGIPLTPDGKIKLPNGTTVDPNDPQVREFIERMKQQAGGAVPQPAAPVTEDTVVAAVITALGGNQTPTARGALKRLLLGEMKTALAEPATTGLAARAILIKPSKDEKDMLLAAAVNTSLLRPGATADPALERNCWRRSMNELRPTSVRCWPTRRCIRRRRPTSARR